MKHVFNFKMQVVPLTSHTLKFEDMFMCFAGWEPRCSDTSRVMCVTPLSPVSQVQRESQEYLVLFDSTFSKAEAGALLTCMAAAQQGPHSQYRSNANNSYG